jgi:ribonuclease PH
MSRHDGRRAEQLRAVKLTRGFTQSAPGSVLIHWGDSVILCTACVEPRVPAWLEGSGKGWITAEYSMLPGSTSPRKARERDGRRDGRTTEIQRLIGRSLRAVTDLEALGERMITVDCDVLQADGGTRTASVTAALVALVDALQSLDPPADAKRWPPLRDSVAAVSVGLVEGQALLDLDYYEDAAAAVDMNVVMTGGGDYVEIQGTGEEATFSDQQLAALLQLARRGIGQLTDLQQRALGRHWPWA